MTVEVAINVPIRKCFDSCWPDDLDQIPKPGLQVLVPFGRQKKGGVVVVVDKISKLSELKFIESLVENNPIFSEEIQSSSTIKLSTPVSNNSWTMPNLNYQNFVGNLDLKGFKSNFLKKKIGKNKFAISKNSSSPLVINNSIIFSDDVGTVFNVSFNGKINWKKNIYKKIYKKYIKI